MKPPLISDETGYPVKESAALGSFEGQVDEFIRYAGDDYDYGHTLFIIWFGANDVYTVKRKPENMGLVAEEIAKKQRDRLHNKVQGNCTFIFLDLANPLSSVLYESRLRNAEEKLRKAISKKTGSRDHAIPPGLRMDTANKAIKAAKEAKLAQDNKALTALTRQIEKIKMFELSVSIFNRQLRQCVGLKGDHLIRIGSKLTEDTIRQLIEQQALEPGANSQDHFSHGIGIAGYNLKKFTRRPDHVNSRTRDLGIDNRGNPLPKHVTTRDKQHPSEALYKLIWQEVRQAIRQTGTVFGNLHTGNLEEPVLSGVEESESATLARMDRVRSLRTRRGMADGRTFEQVDPVRPPR